MVVIYLLTTNIKYHPAITVGPCLGRVMWEWPVKPFTIWRFLPIPKIKEPHNQSLSLSVI